ncbi:hypothetical protein GCM10022226_20140 [Sphaerisporangium flaviroseum]|uniref:DUF7824 domain-containing protein n=1 Tax=Sphaerisporangium flaviroseum TaxID=509199 RepID=A0ABP7HNM3_9ACTN
MTAWDEIRVLIDAGDAGKLIDRLVELDDHERKLVAGELRGHIPFLRARAETLQQQRWREERRRRGRHEPEHEPWQDWADLMRLAGAGTLSAVTAVASWVTRRDLTTWRIFARRPGFGDPAPVVRLLAHRPAQWQAELAERLAVKLRGPRDAGVPLALAMLRHTGVEPPQHDPLVVAWVSAGVGSDPDPLLPALLPRIFEAEGVGRALQHERTDPISPWLRTMRELSESGAVGRASLLDGCLGRFLRGGNAQDLRFFVRLHGLLEPSAAEVKARRRDYLRLLPAAPGPVAELALRHVRRLEAHNPAEVAEALEGLLFRAEATLVRAGLTWFDQTARQAPEQADDLAPALVTAFHHESYDVQHRAAMLALKHAGRFSPLGAETIRDAVPALPPALGERLVTVFGGAAAVPATTPPYIPPPLPAPPAVGAFAAVPATPAAMEALGWTSWEWQDGERWLAGFVRLAGQDVRGLRVALGAAFGSSYSQLYDMRTWTSVDYWRAAMARELITPGTDPGVPVERPEPYHEGRRSSAAVLFAAMARNAEGNQGDGEEKIVEEDDEGFTSAVLPAGLHGQIFGGLEQAGNMTSAHAARAGDPPAEYDTEETRLVSFSWTGYASPFRSRKPRPVPEAPRDRLPSPRKVSPPHLFLLRRCAEILDALKSGTLPPVLLATPTLSTGTLDPDVLVSRLEECEAAHAVPLPADLQQALLRLPRGAHPEAAARAERLTSEAGRTAARWLADGGLPDPEAGVRWSYSEGMKEHYIDERPPAQVGQVSLVPRLKAAPTGLHLIDELLREPAKWSWDDHGGHMGWWPSILPSHREVVAVNLLPHLLYQWNRPGVYPGHAAMLAAADGPAGEATALVLAYFLAQKKPGDAVSVFLTMAARGDLPASTLGVQLGLLVRWTWLKRQHVVNALAEAADRGAHQQVWQVLRTLLPALLPRDGEHARGGLVKLVELATTVAARAGVRGAIPEVAAVAGRRTTSMFARECGRLHDHLTRS